MRMRDLAAASGVPRTTIHYYMREGLLPPPEKTASNAARYGPSHLERLSLIRALRTDELGPFPMRQVRRILQLVDDGMEPELAAVTIGSDADVSIATTPRSATPGDAAEAAGLSPEVLSGLVEHGLLITMPDGELDAADVTAARWYAGILARTGLEAEDLAPIADLVHELARYEETLTRVAAARASEDVDEASAHDLHRMFQSVHQYLIIRHRSAQSE